MGPAAPFIGVQAMYVASKSKNKAVAQEYATNFFATPAVATAIFKDQPRPPALKAVYEEVAASNPDIKAFVEAGANARPCHPSPPWRSPSTRGARRRGNHRWRRPGRRR